MLRNVNQSMVNRYIASGKCKCSNVESNGSSVNGGKITVEFTLYNKEDAGKTIQYITKEDSHKIYDCL